MKKVLFICPNYFHYHKVIEKSLKNNGYSVDYFDDRPKMSILEKGIQRI